MRSPDRVVEMEALLGALRQWMSDLEGLAGMDRDGPGPAVADLPEVDLHSLAAELIALRTDVRLESRGSRAAREKIEEVAGRLQERLEREDGALRDAAASVEVGLRRALDPLLRDRDRLRDDLARAREEPLREGLDALLDIFDALRRGRAETEKARAALGWRSRFLPGRLFDGLLEGYAMASRRVEHCLEAMGVEEVACRGLAFDPRSMRAVETEVRPEVPPGRVVEVIRAGYRRGDRVIRFAEVRTAVAGDGREREQRGGRRES